MLVIVADLQSLLKENHDTKMTTVQVIGDSSRDVFVYCEAKRLAPDLPVPVLQEIKIESNPGMAANVYRNIATKVSDIELITNQGWNDITKTRYVHQETNHLFLRVDKSHDVEPLDMSDQIFDAKILVLSDYNKGFLSESMIEQICSSHERVFLDTKKILGPWAEKAFYIKINNYEFIKSQSFITESMMKKLIITRGSKGCDFNGTNYPVEEVLVRDTSGAGDSFMAALVCEFLKSSDIVESIRVANSSASKVVKTRGVGLI